MAEPPRGVDRVELVRWSLDQVLVGDWVADPDLGDRLRASLEPLATSDFVLAPMGTGDGPLFEPFHGVDGALSFWREWIGPWESYSAELGPPVEGSRGALVELIQRGRMAGASERVKRIPPECSTSGGNDCPGSSCTSTALASGKPPASTSPAG